MSDFAGYKKTIMNAAHNDRIRLALSRAIGSYRSNRNTALTKFPHTIKMAEEVREMRSHAIGNMQAMAEEAVAAIESNKGHGYIAKTAEEALKIIGDLVGTGNSPVVSPTGRDLLTPIILGMLGPVISPSRIPTSLPCRTRDAPSIAVTRDLPTPPLPLIIAILFAT